MFERLKKRVVVAATLLLTFCGLQAVGEDPTSLSVAKIGDKTFSTLAAAFASDEAKVVGAKIELLGNVGLTEELDIVDFNGTLDLGGFELTNDESYKPTSYDWLIDFYASEGKSSSMTITNGTVTLKDGQMFYVCAASTLTIAADTTINEIATQNCSNPFRTYGKIGGHTGESSSSPCTVNVYGTITRTEAEGNTSGTESGVIDQCLGASVVNVYEGAVLTHAFGRVFKMSGGTPTVNISGGTMTAGSDLFHASYSGGAGSAINITGGTFTMESLFSANSEGKTIVVTGLGEGCTAKFSTTNSAVKSLGEFCDEGYEPTLVDGWYVIPSHYVAQVVGGGSYATLEEAFQNVPANGVVKLLADTTGGFNFPSTKGVKATVATLDLNGHVLTGSSVSRSGVKYNAVAVLFSDAVLFVDDSSDGKEGNVVAPSNGSLFYVAVGADNVALNINAGSYTMSEANPLVEVSEFTSPDIDLTISINDGTFVGNDFVGITNGFFDEEVGGGDEFLALSILTTGGTFDFDPSSYVPAVDYIDPDYVAEKQGDENVWVVRQLDYVAQIGDKKYESLAEAVEKAYGNVTAPVTITLLKSCSGDGILVPANKFAADKALTIDLAGYTYTCNGNPTGSANTKNQAFQLNQGNTITIKDGTLNVAADVATQFRFVIQNYSNLTLDKVTVDGTNLKMDGKIHYTVSNNNGTTEIKNGSEIIASQTGDTNFAFDVCRYSTYPSVSVTVNGATINGNVEVSASNNNAANATLSIQNATFGESATLVIDDSAAGATVTKAAGVTVALDSAHPQWKWNDAGTALTKNVFMIGTAAYDTLADAVAAAEAGQTVKIYEAGTHTLPNLPKNITIEGAVDGVVFNCVGSDSICSVPNGATLKNATFNFGTSNYHGFQHAGTMTFDGCTLNGLFFSYGNMNFNGCTFNAPGEEYSMWCYGKDCTYTDCVFNGAGKFLNVYCESSSEVYNITLTRCTFNSTKVNKAAVNVKATSSKGTLKYNVVLEDCSTNENFPTDKRLNSKLVMVDDGDSESVTVTLDGTTVYETLKANAEDGFYHITNLAELKRFRDQVNGAAPYGAANTFAGKTVVLDNDITFTGDAWTSGIGDGSHAFKGTFDGQNHKITGLTINAPTSEYVALFGNVTENVVETSDQVIKNLTIDGAEIHGAKYVGGIVAKAFRETIQNCTVTNSQIIGGAQVGGIVAYAEVSSVKDCSVGATTVSGTDRAGGLVGKLQSSTLAESNVGPNVTVSADGLNGICGAGALVSQIYVNEGNASIKKCSIDSVTVKTANEVAFVPAGNFAPGEFDTSKIDISEVKWMPVSGMYYYDMVNPADSSLYVRVNNYIPVAQIGDNKYYTLDEAFAAAQSGETLEILVPDEYKLPSSLPNITIDAKVTGVVFDCEGSGQICQFSNGATIKNATLNFGTASYHGFQHQGGTLLFDNCVLNGLFFSYGDMTFNHCTFNALGQEYSMWCYGKDCTYTDCDFYGAGKFLNVYCESNSEVYNITLTRCTFNSTVLNKAPVNVKGTCGATQLKYNVVVTDCDLGTGDLGKFPIEGTKIKTTGYVVSPFVMVDDINNYTGDDITVTVDGVAVFRTLGQDSDGNYLINDLADLKLFRAMVNGLYPFINRVTFAGKTVKLMNSITFAGDAWDSGIGNGTVKFAGTFDGNGKAITGLKITANQNYVGLFGGVWDAKISNLTLEAPVISNTATDYTGAIVGAGYANITGCTVTGGSVTGVEQVGGIVGYLSCGSVKNCEVNGVAVKATDSRAGGIVGKANVDSQYEIVGNSVSGGSVVSGDSFVGALVGQIMASANNHWQITDNKILTVPTTVNGETVFSPIGQFRNGDSYQANSLTAGHIARNYWEPTATLYVDIYNPANSAEFLHVPNFIMVAQIGTDKYNTLQEAIAAAEGNLSQIEVLVTGVDVPAGYMITDLADEKHGLDWNYAIFANGQGTEEDPYQIPDLVTLKNFRDLVNYGCTFAGKFVKVTADIDMQNEAWTPIGSHASKIAFVGTFDGNGKTLSNLNVSGEDVALFGQTYAGSYLKNFTVRGSTVVTVANGGGAGIVGYMSGGTIDGVTNYVDVTVQGTYARLGGIAGIANDDGVNLIKNCANYGTISPDLSLEGKTSGICGGLIGQSMFKMIVQDSENHGEVIGRSQLDGIGGIVGVVKYDEGVSGVLKFVRCTNYGKLTSNVSGNMGGIVGKYYGGKKGGSSTGNIGATFDTCANYGELDGSVVSSGYQGDLIGGYEWPGQVADVVTGTITVRKGTRVVGNFANMSSYAGFRDLTAMVAGTTEVQGEPIETDTYYLGLVDVVESVKPGDTVKLLADNAENIDLPISVSLDTNGKNYTGTYRATISTVDELVALSTKVNGGDSFAGKTVVLTADIDMTDVAFSPIGNVTDYPSITFKGLFDGQNHTISNLKTSDATANYATAGLFGSIKGTVQNVRLTNVDITSSHYAAAVVGYISEGPSQIVNCHVDGGTITSVPEFIGSEYDNGDKAGGIIGYSSASGSVSGCTVSNLTIKAYRDVGGVAGYSGGPVTNCEVAKTTVVQDNTHGYKDSVTTYGEIVGGGTSAQGSTATDVTVVSMLSISTAAELKAFAEAVNNGTSFAGKKIVLTADIDLGNEEWTPINANNSQTGFTFDGNGKTISNLKVSGDGKAVGLFGRATSCTIKNLTIDGAAVTGINHVGAIAGNGLCTKIENCTVKNAVVTTNVKDNDDGDKAGAIVGYLSGEPNAWVKNCTVENCTVTGYRDIGGAVGIANSKAEVSGVTVKDTTVVNDKSVNYKNYATDAEYDIGKVVGETAVTATVSGNTDTENVTIVQPTMVAKMGANQYATLQGAFAAAGTAKNVTIELLSDVDLAGVEWPSIQFNGTFNGNGKKISNLKVSYDAAHQGFIRYSDMGAVVENVTFEDSTIAGQRASVVIGYGYGCTIENVTVDGATITGVQKCGGVIALVGENAPLTITGCTVKDLQFKYAEEGKNEGSGFGGLVGCVNYGVNAVITGNKVSGVSFEGAVDQTTLDAWIADAGYAPEKAYQWTCHPFIAAVTGTALNNSTAPVSVQLADNEVEQVGGLLKGPTTTDYMGFFYREGTPGIAANQHVVDITVDGQLMPNHFIAKIGDVDYYSLNEAMAAVKPGETVKLVRAPYAADDTIVQTLPERVFFDATAVEGFDPANLRLPASCPSDEYSIVAVEESVYTVRCGYVARIQRNGEFLEGGYATLTDAAKKTVVGDVVVMMRDVTECLSIPVGGKKVITLDLNGWALTGADYSMHAFTLAKAAIVLKSDANLTIIDSSEEQTGTIIKSNVMDVPSYQVLVAEESYGAKINIKGGSYEIAGGESFVSVDPWFIYADPTLPQPTKLEEPIDFTLNVEDGLFAGDGYVADINDVLAETIKVNVSGGDFVGGNLVNFENHEETVVLTGGTYAVEPTAECLAPNYRTDKNGDDNWIVRAMVFVAEVVSNETTTKYETVEGAVAAAQDSDTVRVFADWQLLKNAEVKANNVTIQAVDGAKVTGGDLYGFTVTGDNVTFKNMTLEQCKQSAYNASIYFTRQGAGSTMTIDNCTINGNRCVVVADNVADNGKLVIKDSDLTGVYPINVQTGKIDIEVTDSGLHGWTSYGKTVKSATFTRCDFSQGDSNYHVVAAYANTTFTNCDFGEGQKLYAQIPGFSWTFDSCTVGSGANKVDLTSENLGTILPDDAWSVLNQCTTTLNGDKILHTVEDTTVEYLIDPAAWLVDGYASRQLPNGKWAVGGDTWIFFAADAYAEGAKDANAKTLTIASAGELGLFAKEVNAGTNYANWTVTIAGEIDLAAHRWFPIDEVNGNLAGSTIQGNDCVIKNMKVTEGAGDYGINAGFISRVIGNSTPYTIKNLTFSKADVSLATGNGVGVVIGKSYGTTIFENVVVTDSKATTADSKAGILLGYAAEDPAVTLKNCSVENCTVIGGDCCAVLVGHYPNGGTFNLENTKVDVNTKVQCANVDKFVGGTFTGTVDGFTYTYGLESETETKGCLIDPANGWTSYRNGKTIDGYGLKGDDIFQPAVKIDDWLYCDFESALAAAVDGDKITLLRNIDSAKGVSIAQGRFPTAGLTIDFNGHTYTAVSDPAGSTGTQNQVFQLNKGNKITFADGTVTVAQAASELFRMVVQNYADLTLDNVTLDGTNLAANKKDYTLSNNNGEVFLMNGTTIIAQADGIAFDAYDWDPYYDGVSVEILTDDVRIAGQIEVGTSSEDDPDFSVTIPLAYFLDPPEYFKWVEQSGKQVLTAKDFVAIIDDNEHLRYESLAEAVNMVPADGEAHTIKVLKNCSGAGLFLGADLNKDITIDMKGFTFTCTGPAVGSTGTKSQALHLEKGNAVTILNGTINSGSTDVKMLVQNYCDLTLTGVKLDGTHLYGLNKDGVRVARYVLSSNSGNVVVGAGTTITAKDGDYAMDACLYGTYAKPTVTVEAGARIEGNVDLTGGDFTLAGTLNGALVTTGSETMGTVQKLATTELAPLEGWAWTATGAAEGYVKLAKAVAQIGTTTYASLVEAFEAVPANGTATITLLDNASGAGIFLAANGNKNITLDLNTYTYTCTGPAVGSKGTQSQALHLEEGNTVTILNGTITSDSENVKMLVQNYCNLTLEDVTLDGTHLYGLNKDGVRVARYVLSNNSGSVVVGAGTTITAKDGDYAMDACLYGTYTKPKVTVADGALIDGDVDLTGGDFTLAGTLNGALVTTGSETMGTVQKLATTELAPLEGWAWTATGAAEGYVKLATAVAQIGTTTYASLVEAFEAVPANGTATIKLLNDASGAGIFLAADGSKTITLDLNGKTYTCTGPAVGSTGTKSQALHLEKGNTVTIKNGVITSTKESGVKMLVQNYCDLTLDHVELDGRGLIGEGRYVLSNNSGAVLLKNGTTVTAKTGDIAIDSCQYATYPIPTLTINGATVKGPVELTGGNLELVAGTFNNMTLTGTVGEAKVQQPANGSVLPPAGWAWTTTGADDGKVRLATAVAQIGTTTYASLIEAVAAVPVEGSATIEVLRSSEGAGIALFEADKKNITINLGTNTYSVVKDAVGSNGTKSQGFHFEKGNTVTINAATVGTDTGTLTSNCADVKMLVQNYCDLTLTGVTLDGTHLYGLNKDGVRVARYVLSNNSGNVVVGEGTKINANDGDYAMDSCKSGTYTKPTVTVVEGATVSGNVDLTGGDFTLAGTLSGMLVTTDDDSTMGLVQKLAANTTLAPLPSYSWTTAGAEEGYVRLGKSVAKINDQAYASLADAVAAAVDGDKVELFQSIPDGVGILIPQDKFATNGLTIDLGGNTYTAVGPAVGSSNTKNQVFQILKGNNVTIQNGTVNVAKDSASLFKFIIQNYSDLDLEDVTLDGTNLAFATTNYTLSNNCGTINLGEGTEIIAVGDNVAFDTYDYRPSYETVPSVTVDGATVTGDVELGGGNLTLTSGSISGSLMLLDDKNTGDVRKQPLFDIAAPEGFAWTVPTGADYETLGAVCVMIGDVGYATLADAVAAAEDGDTITLTDHCSGAGLFLEAGSKSITIDMKGYTFTCTGPAVGSNGTQTQALHLEAGNTVTIKNGTITSTKDSGVKMLVQNYANLTLEDVALDGEKLEGSNRYVLSNNSGTVNLTGTTSVTAKTGDVAIDACLYGSYPAPTVNLNLNKTGTVQGDVELTGGSFNYTAGTITGDVNTGSNYADTQVTGLKVRVGDDPADSKLYFDLQTALNAAGTAKTTATILEDVNVAQPVEVTGELTLDLAGKTVAYTSETDSKLGVLVVHNGATLTITDTSDAGTGAIRAGSNVYAGVVMTKAGDSATEPATLTLEKGAIEGYYYGIVGNGNRDNTSITINGGTVTATAENDNLAIFNPQDGTVTIKGGTLTGYASAVEMRAGTLNITGGTLTATATKFSAAANGSGNTVVGAAVAISQHNTNKALAVNISGGEFSGVKAVYEEDLQDETVDGISLAITGGKFAGEIASENVTKFVSGGVFSMPVAATSCADGLSSVANPDATTSATYPYAVMSDVYVYDDEPTGLSVRFPRSWITSEDGLNIPAAEATDAKIDETLATAQANGLPTWQNILLGIDGANTTGLLATFAKDPTSTATNPKILVTFKGLDATKQPTWETGVTITYTLYLYTSEDATAWTAVTDGVTNTKSGVSYAMPTSEAAIKTWLYQLRVNMEQEQKSEL